VEEQDKQKRNYFIKQNIKTGLVIIGLYYGLFWLTKSLLKDTE